MKSIFGKSGLKAAAIIIFLLFAQSGCFYRQVTVSPDGLPARSAYLDASGNILEGEIFSARADIDVVTPQGHYPVKAVIILRRPSYLRLEILSTLGVPDYYIAADPESMRIFIPAQGKYYQGRPSAQKIFRFFYWPLSIEDTVMILSGGFPMIADASYKAQKTDNVTVVQAVSAQKGLQIIELDNGRLRQFIQKDRHGQRIYSVYYAYDGRQSRMPESIMIKMADGITSLRVRYNDPLVEKSDDLSFFNLPLPPGIKPVDLE